MLCQVFLRFHRAMNCCKAKVKIVVLNHMLEEHYLVHGMVQFVYGDIQGNLDDDITQHGLTSSEVFYICDKHCDRVYIMHHHVKLDLIAVSV
mmetsp:Transcript_5317/g.10970  ORF Transcript_5317/g.10970 Transcript_5317/m.10970 type:complete len:92 (+) Transcript_5317:1012-1287(+)